MNRSTLIAFRAGGMSAQKQLLPPDVERTRSGRVTRAARMTAGS